MALRIVSDSSCNLTELEGYADFRSVPLKILADGREFVDEEGLDLEAMVEAVEGATTSTSTSCPSPGEWLDSFEGADEIIALTISSQLSGSYSAALVAQNDYLQEHPEAKIHIIDTLSTGGEMVLLMEKIVECVNQGMSFEEIVEQTSDYHKRTRLLFYLESLSNLARNGRVNSTIAKLAGLFGIRFVGKASEKGTIQQASVNKGENKALSSVVAEMGRMGFKGGKVRISETLNELAAFKLKDKIIEAYHDAEVSIISNTGLCSFYAERGGMIIGFEGEPFK